MTYRNRQNLRKSMDCEEECRVITYRKLNEDDLDTFIQMRIKDFLGK